MNTRGRKHMGTVLLCYCVQASEHKRTDTHGDGSVVSLCPGVRTQENRPPVLSSYNPQDNTVAEAAGRVGGYQNQCTRLVEDLYSSLIIHLRI